MKKSVFSLALATLLFASCSSDDNSSSTPTPEVPVGEAIVQPTVGGPNQPNQVFIDLSTTEQATNRRDAWDLGFSTGSDFRVIINGSVKMAVKKLETTDITQVQVADESVSVGFSTFADLGYVDNPTGVLQGAGNGIGTAIAEVSANESDNKVYLVNLGFNVGTTAPAVGSVSLDGEARGWKKIRVNRNGNGYKVDYADLNATTFQTVNISKNADFNFVFLSLATGQEVSAQPRKDKWDVCFTGFTNYFNYAGGQITYYYADFITTNMLGGTQVYPVLLEEGQTLEETFASFTSTDVVEANFSVSITDQRVIGDTWRVGGGPSSLPSVKDDRFFVIKDASGNLYKLIFRALTNDAGERGYPVFEYELL